jgi:type II secretory pathway pseudopilin PulG
MKRAKSTSGFILITTLLVVALAVIMISVLIDRSTIFFPLTQTVIEREKAQQLAYGGIQLALSQLAYADVVQEAEQAPQTQKGSQETKKDTAPDTQQQAGASQTKQFLKTLVPVLNTWQTVKLNAEHDDIDGEIKICIMSEDGKININELYDFKKHSFVGSKSEQDNIKKALTELFATIKKTSGGQDIFESLESFLKKRDEKIRDVTELLSIKPFEIFKNNIFYSPDGPQSGKDKKSIYLTDVFTIWTQKKTMDPWLFSHSVRTLLELPIPDKNAIADAIKVFNGAYTWPASWNNVFLKIYKKDFNSLAKGITPLLNTTFGPETFSVLSYGTVGRVTHRLFAILERDTSNRKSKDPATVHIKKLYWI